MTPAEQKAWLAGRDAAADVAIKHSYSNNFYVSSRMNQAAQDIRALPPPAVTAWTPPPEAERPLGYECQIMTDAMWNGGAWVTRNKFILDGGVYAFAPLPGVQDE